MDNYILLIIFGFLIGTAGTLIGAGGGFILVPGLILTHPVFSAETITAISIAIVAANAISGSVAYAKSGRIDYKAGLLFAAFTVPGSIAGVYTTQFIPMKLFHIAFGILLFGLAVFLFLNRAPNAPVPTDTPLSGSRRRHTLTDKEGNVYCYVYNNNAGILVSIVVGFISPLLGIGGGIIHVPALVNWLRFPVHIATATSHFILAVMATVSVVVHILHGNYNDPQVLQMVTGLGIGVVIGAQLGAYLSHKFQGKLIIRALAICLGIVGIRIFFESL